MKSSDRVSRAGAWGRSVLVLLCATVLVACGGSEEDTSLPGALGAATVGTAGGVVRSDDGAEVSFPRDALDANLTVRISRDSTGAPPTPPAVQSASAVYAITPHGGDFRLPVTVSVPVEQGTPVNGEQLHLMTAKPGDTQWTVLSGATYANGRMSAPVMGFSYFRVVTIPDLGVPTLVSAMGNPGGWYNNVGGDGIAGTFAAGYTFSGMPWREAGPFYSNRVPWLYARMTYPTRSPLAAALGLPVPNPCRPVSYAHTGANWAVHRNGAPYGGLYLTHDRVLDTPADAWPRYESGGLPTDTRRTSETVHGGFGAVHYFGADNPARGPLLPADNADPWPSPPDGNNAVDDTLTWRAQARFNSSRHNGWYRIEVSVQTDCGFAVQAAPIGFAMAAGDDSGGGLGNTETLPLIRPLVARVYVPVGDTATFEWIVNASAPTLVRVEFATDGSNGPWTEVPASWVSRGTATRVLDGFPTVKVTIPNVQEAQRGVYRLLICRAEIYCSFSGGVAVIPMTAPPAVTADPQSVAVRLGEGATFTAASDPNCIASPDWGYGLTTTGCTVQWQKQSVLAAAFGFNNWTPIPGANANTYTIGSATLDDHAMLYRAVFTNGNGSRASQAALLTVVAEFVAPSVTAQPVDQNVTAGSTAVFVATVAGTPPFSYQWRRNGQNVAGANALSLTLSNVSEADAGAYDLQVSNPAGSVITTAANLVVSPAPPPVLPPQIAAAPASLTVAAGNAANFTVAVTGTGPFTYAWLKNGQPIASAENSPSLGIASAAAGDAGQYAVRVTNAVGTVLSASATLTVQSGTEPPVAPTIVTPPTGLAVLPGQGATFAVAVTGTGPLTYTWKRNGAAIAGASGPVLHLPSVSANDAGSYAVEVVNTVGVAASTPAPLIVIGAPSITLQPVNATASEGQQATFTVAADGNGLRYLWTRNGIAIAGASSPSHVTPALTAQDNGAVYQVFVYNGAGLVISSQATLTVNAVQTVAWASPRMVADGIYSQPSVAIDDQGRALAVWVGGDRMYAATSQAGGAWSSAVTVDNGLSGNRGGYSPKVVASPSGAIVAAWGYNTTLNQWPLAVARGSTTGLGAAQKLADSFSGDSIALAIDDSGRAAIAYENGSRIYISFSASAQAAWTTPLDVVAHAGGTSGGVPEIAVDSAGQGFMVHQQGNTIVVTPVNLATASLGMPTSFTRSSVADPRIAVDENGGAVLAYFSYANNWGVWAQTYTPSGGWSAPAVLDDDSAFDRALAVGSDGAGNAIVAWKKQVITSASGGSYYDTVHASRYTAGSGWATRSMVSVPEADGVESIQVAASRNGRIVVSWVQDDPDFFARSHARVFEGNWLSPGRVQVSDNYGGLDSDPLSFKSLALSPTTGHAILLWTETIDNGQLNRPEPVFSAYLPR